MKSVSACCHLPIIAAGECMRAVANERERNCCVLVKASATVVRNRTIDRSVRGAEWCDANEGAK